MILVQVFVSITPCLTESREVARLVILHWYWVPATNSMAGTTSGNFSPGAENEQLYVKFPGRGEVAVTSNWIGKCLWNVGTVGFTYNGGRVQNELGWRDRRGNTLAGVLHPSPWLRAVETLRPRRTLVLHCTPATQRKWVSFCALHTRRWLWARLQRVQKDLWHMIKMNSCRMVKIFIHTWLSVVMVYMLYDPSSQPMSCTDGTLSIVCNREPVGLLVFVVSTWYCMEMGKQYKSPCYKMYTHHFNVSIIGNIH